MALPICFAVSETAANGGEAGPDPPAAPDGGEGAAAHVLQQQVDTEKEGPGVAPLQQQHQVQPAPCDGVATAGSLGVVVPGAGPVGRGGVEEEKLAPGAEQERPERQEGKLMQAAVRIPTLLGALPLCTLLAGASDRAGTPFRGNSTRQLLTLHSCGTAHIQGSCFPLGYKLRPTVVGCKLRSEHYTRHHAVHVF